MPTTWTIHELRRQVEARLAGDEAPANGQVRAVPDERSIRYYTTLGLLDRPQLRGRTALYGERHLAQLVVIKRLQAEGKTLAEIQHELPTLDDAALTKLSGVPLAPARRAARRDFWRDADTVAESEPDTEPAPAPPPSPPVAPFAQILELALAPGVRLAFASTREATDADAAALLAAASPLLAELVRRHLLPQPQASHAPDPEDIS